MSAYEAVAAILDEARSDLLDAAAGLEDPDLDMAATRAAHDVLWEAGLVEDWLRRCIDLTARGLPAPVFASIACPSMAGTPGYLEEWLAQTRRPLVALLRRLPADALDLECALPGEPPASVRALAERVAASDRAHAAELRAQHVVIAGGS